MLSLTSARLKQNMRCRGHGHTTHGTYHYLWKNTGRDREVCHCRRDWCPIYIEEPASLQHLYLHKKILPLQTVQSCYRKLCIVVTEIGALLLPKSVHSQLPKSVHFSLPFTSGGQPRVSVLQPPDYRSDGCADGISGGICG